MTKFKMSDYLSINPNMITISPTHKCSASCEQCCFGCSPKIRHIMKTEDIIRYVDIALSEFPSILVCIITGGECFMIGDDLVKIIKHISQYKIEIRVVTNAYWASTYNASIKKLTPLINAGLTEINFSTGDDHQKYVDFNNIVNAAKASVDLGLKTVFISIESHPDYIFCSKYITSNATLKPFIESKKINFVNASWMCFKTTTNINIKNNNNFEYIDFNEVKNGCDNIFKNIVINPYSQLLACCGLTVEHNPYLKLGDLNVNSLKDLYTEQFNDLFKFWLFVDGPEYIYNKLMINKNKHINKMPHECAYCIELINSDENVRMIKEILVKELPNIIYRHQLKKTKPTLK